MVRGIAINGGRSAIARTLVTHWLDPRETVTQVPRGEDMPLDTHRYLFCQGLLRAKRADEQTAAESTESFEVNFEWIRRQCNAILAKNKHARICVIGSESGITGSYDGSYAGAKTLLHRYAESKQLIAPAQQLVCIAPTIIADAGMTQRRHDLDTVYARAKEHPKGRWLQADEVAGLIHHVLYVDKGYLSGVTIRINGGAHNGKGQAR